MYVLLKLVGEAGWRRQSQYGGVGELRVPGAAAVVVCVVVLAGLLRYALCAVPLALLVSRMHAAHDVQASLPSYEIAVVAYLPNARLDLHGGAD